MIPKSSLCNRLGMGFRCRSSLMRLIVTISTTNYRIMGFPVSIQNTNYERNGTFEIGNGLSFLALLFNLCFVFDKTASIISYEQVVSKIARVLKSLEVRSSAVIQLDGGLGRKRVSFKRFHKSHIVEYYCSDHGRFECISRMSNIDQYGNYVIR